MAKPETIYPSQRYQVMYVLTELFELDFFLPVNGYMNTVNPLPDEKNLDWSKLKEIADDILKCIKSEK